MHYAKYIKKQNVGKNEICKTLWNLSLNFPFFEIPPFSLQIQRPHCKGLYW